MKAKRREQVSERIATKIRSESNLHHEIQEAERELKTLRIQTDSTEAILKQKEIAVSLKRVLSV
jgi:molybdopterin-biosynthesis enzyme MoeA-like protein